MIRLLLVAALAFAAQAGSPQVLKIAGGTLAYDEAGKGPAVILLHGSFLDRGTWDLQMPPLAARYRAIRYDIRPFGESSVPEKPYKTTDDLLALMDALKIDRAHLVGHSFGGGVAIDFALAHPSRVRSLVLVNSGVTGAQLPADEQKDAMQVFISARDGEAKAVEAWMALGLWSASRSRPDVMKAIERITTRNAARFRMTAPPFAPITPPAIGRLGDIRAATLVVSGERDTPGNRAASDAVAKGIPRATLVIIPGADHAIPIGWATDLNGAMLKFLAAQLHPASAGLLRALRNSPLGALRDPRGPALRALRALRGPALRALGGRLHHVLPRNRHRLTDDLFVCSRKAHHRRALPPPGACGRLEHGWMGAEELRLLLGCQPDHASRRSRSNGGEDFPADSKVGVIHVRRLGGVGHSEGDASELVWSHRGFPSQGARVPGCQGARVRFRSGRSCRTSRVLARRAPATSCGGWETRRPRAETAVR
jgi:pimeloyl-ACP methyl ester carboxylesterase